ncbi:universal stress protein [Kutzneria kofuensis]|uniref:Nucleotide-binding universal stress UspA family protein n=1 Tax=Kutzneria kofuensis TaxID=103725 RepID=A0A7W9KSS2_9PSEU|nr:universal stress protein [Kutzneria kofuensis]MBB5898052.1 nucleotide-binding universal stress UspA family protein [Kutzneria kofuensis]
MTSNVVGRQIVAAVDGSQSALDAVRWAADEAARRGMALQLTHAMSFGAIAYGGAYAWPKGYFEAVEHAGRVFLADAESLVHKSHPGLSVTTQLVEGSPVPVLVDASEHAALIVLGSRGLGGFTGILIGSTATATIARAHCPVVVVRGDQPAPDGPVVVGVDGSPTSEDALAWAYEEASSRGVELVAVHGWTEFASESSYAFARQFIVDWDAVQTRQEQHLAERLAGYAEKYPDVTVRRVVEGCRARQLLLDQARGAQLVVVGSRGRAELGGLLLGSTSQALIRHAPCPVLVVRAHQG